jgi:hypothetical protein
VSAVAAAASEKLWQPRDVDGDPSRLIFREHVRLPRLDLGLAAVDVGDRLSTGVTDDVAAGYRVGVLRCGETAWWFCHSSCLSIDALERHGESLTPLDRRVGFSFKDSVNLIPDGLPFRALTGEVEFGQHAFELVEHLGMAMKPWIGTTFVKKGFDLIHRVSASVPHGVAPSRGCQGS